ncbi:MAG TPA: acyl-CoA thioesterase [Candidatus Latescibacteria bacterium]|nr:acyl-CoA thioesterase [Candidatus Latescibacterota bacterium]
MTADAFDFELELEVRDYECDLQGVVNNAVYLNYLEHTRHQYLRSRGVDFAALHEAGCDLIMTRCEVDFKGSLRSGDRFVVLMSLSRESRLRFLFHQKVLRLPDRTAMLEARIIGTGLIAGRPGLPDVLQALMDG